MIYLDHNATTPPHPDVLTAMQRAHEAAWANPSSTHRPGQAARALLDRARAAVARLTERDARDVVLTSGGTEANNLALRSLVHGVPAPAIVASRIEHPSVVRAVETLEREGAIVRWADVSPSGVVSVDAIIAAMDSLDQVTVVALMAVNHESGVIQPVAEVAEAVHARGAALHVDVVQAVGKLPLSWSQADTLSVAAHKIRGPKGIGALLTRPKLKVHPLLVGGAQERGLRPGTQSAALAAGFAAACEHALEGPARYTALAPLRDRIEKHLLNAGGLLNGPLQQSRRAPHVSNLSLPGWRAAELCAALDLEGVAVSAGAACSAGTAEPSAVVTAMLGQKRAKSAVRISLGETTSGEDIDGAIAKFERVLNRRAPVEST